MKRSIVHIMLAVLIFCILSACGESPATELAEPVSTPMDATATRTPLPSSTRTPFPRSTSSPTLVPRPTVVLPAEGLVAYYPFNASTQDESGNGNHGENYGATFIIDRYERPVSAAFFNGQDYIQVPNNYGLNLVNDFSIAFWIKPEPPPWNVFRYIIIGKGEVGQLFTDGRTDHSGWELFYDLSQQDVKEHPIYLSVVFPPSDSNHTAYHFNARIPLDAWSCVVVTFDDYLNLLSYYENGLLSSYFTELFLDLRVNPRKLYIGSTFIGAIDDIAIYDRTLSAVEAGAVCGVMVDLSTATPTPSKTPTPSPLPSSTPVCAPGWARLMAGEYAVVMPGDPNRVRSEPRRGDNILSTLDPGAIVRVLEGPVCADGLVFWKVGNDTIPGGAGWTAEGDMQTYWLEPYQH